jgi:TolA-binding protein
MSRTSSSMRASLRAFRALTATPADGAATRARVLARAGRVRSRRASWRRFATPVLATMAISISASAAWTTLAPAWHAPTAAVIGAGLEEDPRPPRREPFWARAVRTIPVAEPEVSLPNEAKATIACGDEAEARSYARAHRAHFVDQSASRALAAWNEYLRRYPRGTLAPEAQFNRALCLVHLGRFDEASRALRTFTATRRDGYRHADVERLLGWLRDREPPPAANPRAAPDPN